MISVRGVLATGIAVCLHSDWISVNHGRQQPGRKISAEEEYQQTEKMEMQIYERV